MECSVAAAEGATLTNTKQVDACDLVSVKKILHAAMQITIDVVIEIVESIRPVGIAPVDEVHVEPGIEEATNQRPIDLQIHHVRTVDERVADQHRCDARRPGKWLIAIQGDLILTPHRGGSAC